MIPTISGKIVKGRFPVLFRTYDDDGSDNSAHLPVTAFANSNCCNDHFSFQNIDPLRLTLSCDSRFVCFTTTALPKHHTCFRVIVHSKGIVFRLEQPAAFDTSTKEHVEQKEMIVQDGFSKKGRGRGKKTTDRRDAGVTLLEDKFQKRERRERKKGELFCVALPRRM